MTNKTRVFHVRVVGFSAPERQMLNSIFLLSVAPARQIGYKLWNPETGAAPDMYLLDGDSESAVLSWQATFSSTSDRTLVVGSKNTDLGVASAARPLGLKVVGAMDRLAIALNNQSQSNANVEKETSALDASVPRANRTLPTAAVASSPKEEVSVPRAASNVTVKQPAMAAQNLAASMNASVSAGMSAAALSAAQATAAANALTVAQGMGGANVLSGTMPTMTAAAPAATVLPNMLLQPIVAPAFDKSINEKPVTEKAVDRILSDKPYYERGEKSPAEKPAVEKTTAEKTVAEKSAAAMLTSSGVTPLTPAALLAAVTPAPRANLRVVTNSPLAASLPAATPPAARIAEAPMNPPPAAPVATPTPAPVALPVVAAPVVIAPAVAAPVAAPPVAVTPVVAPPSPPVIPPAAPTPRHEEQVFRVLAVDDSPLMRTFLQNKLAPYGIQPEFAASGEEALFKISKQHFDMIFLDVMLPGMDGYDVCKMIKKNKDNSLMKVVMLTSKDKTFDKIRGTMAGCDGYLTKPVDELKLRAIIERHTVTRK